MDNSPNPPSPDPTQPTVTATVSGPTVKISHAHRFIFGYIALIVLAAAVGGIYTWQHRQVNELTNQISALNNRVVSLSSQLATAKTSNEKVPSTSSASSTSKQYLTITQWGVRAPYTSSDTLSYSAPQCYTTSTPNIGCAVDVISKNVLGTTVDPTDVHGDNSCTNLNGNIGQIEQLSGSENYSADDGSGFTPISQYIQQNPGKFSQVGNNYYVFSPNNNVAEAACTATSANANYKAQLTTAQTLTASLAADFSAIP